MMRALFVAASALALAACGGGDTGQQTTVDDMAANDSMTTNMGMSNSAMGNMAMAGGTVTVTVNGVQQGGGPVLVALQGEGDFAKAAGSFTGRADPTASAVTVTIAGVTPGRYAAAVVQDSNNDGTFNIGATGPTEPFGFSGTAQSGAPSFGPAAFEVSASGGTATVTLSGGASGN